MKPVVTWAILAKSNLVKVVENKGPGKGFTTVNQKTWHAEPPVDYADEAGQSHNRTGHGQASMTRRDPKDLAESNFAVDVAERLTELYHQSAFDRVILVAGPQMLGKLRTALKGDITQSILAEVDKDLTHIPVDQLADHLADVIAA